MNPEEDDIYEDDSDERSPDDTFALEFLGGFLQELILNYRKYSLSAKTLMAISRALYITENFGKVTFDGSLSIASGTRYNEGGSVSYEVTILSDEITFSLSGSEYTEGVGSDSVYEEFYSFGQSDESYDLSDTLERWKENFYAFFEDGRGLSVSDQTENLEGPDEDDYN